MIAFPTLVLAVISQMQPAPATPLPGSNVTPLPLMSGSPVPVESPATTPTGGPLPAGSNTPSPTATTPAPATTGTQATFTYRFVPRQPTHPVPGAPQILAVYLNSKTLVSQGSIAIKVMTDPGTVKVTSKSNGREGVIPMIAPGDFEAYSKLPKIPFIAAGMTVRLEFTATSADGKTVSVQVPVALK